MLQSLVVELTPCETCGGEVTKVRILVMSPTMQADLSYTAGPASKPSEVAEILDSVPVKLLGAGVFW